MLLDLWPALEEAEPAGGATRRRTFPRFLREEVVHKTTRFEVGLDMRTHATLSEPARHRVRVASLWTAVAHEARRVAVGVSTVASTRGRARMRGTPTMRLRTTRIHSDRSLSVLRDEDLELAAAELLQED